MRGSHIEGTEKFIPFMKMNFELELWFFCQDQDRHSGATLPSYSPPPYRQLWWFLEGGGHFFALMKWSRITGRLRTLTRTGDKNPINQHHKVTWEHYGGIFKGYESNNPLLRHVNSTPHPRFTTRPGLDHMSGVRVGKPSTVSLLVIRLCSNWSHYKDNR